MLRQAEAILLGAHDPRIVLAHALRLAAQRRDADALVAAGTAASNTDPADGTWSTGTTATKPGTSTRIARPAARSAQSASPSRPA